MEIEQLSYQMLVFCTFLAGYGFIAVHATLSTRSWSQSGPEHMLATTAADGTVLIRRARSGHARRMESARSAVFNAEDVSQPSTVVTTVAATTALPATTAILATPLATVSPTRIPSTPPLLPGMKPSSVTSVPTLAPRTALAKRALPKRAKLASPTAKSKTALAKTRRARQAIRRKRKGVTGNTTKATSAASTANASDEPGDGEMTAETAQKAMAPAPNQAAELTRKRWRPNPAPTRLRLRHLSPHRVGSPGSSPTGSTWPSFSVHLCRPAWG